MKSIIKAAEKRAKKKVKNDQEFDEYLASHVPNIKVVGVGGAGGNTVMRLLEMGVDGAHLVAVNTDAQDLSKVKADEKILIGREATKGLGAGSDPSVGEEAAKEDEAQLRKVVGDADLVFITCGLGGGTGSGAAPIVAEVSKKSGALTIAVVTVPFDNEGLLRWENARYGLERLKNHVDAVIVIPNQRLLDIVPDLPITTAFRVADEILANAVKGITRMVTSQGLVNVDFADLKAVMMSAGGALIGVGESDSEKRAEEAVEKAINNPLLDLDIKGSKGALIYIEGGKGLKLEEAYKVVDLISQHLAKDSKLIWGVGLPDDSMGNTLKVIVIVTGANLKDFYYPQQDELDQKEKERMSKELGIEFIEVEE
ncbi:MAG: cell division protein FtsZ [Candidatus Altiarchaeota archaeon]|nr:cell division protein FtsZ [Candidatus Altiarchaeota archaeon]